MIYLDGSRSQFPNKIDAVMELFTLPSNKKGQVKRYQELITKDKLSSEEIAEMKSLQESLEQHIFDVEKWNQFGDILINMQKFFKDDVEPYIEEKKLDFDKEVDKFIYMGEWTPNVKYDEKNTVSHNGRSYICKISNTNKSPSDPMYWGLIAEKGDKGEPSLNINYKGDYDGSMSYTLGDAVVYGEQWYYAKKNNKGIAPPDKDSWELFNGQIHTGKTEPFDSRVALWLDKSADDKLGLLSYYNEDTKAWEGIKATGLVDSKTNTEMSLSVIKEQLDSKANSKDIPMKVSELDNDSGFITKEDIGNAGGLGSVESVNGKTGKVILTGDDLVVGKGLDATLGKTVTNLVEEKVDKKDFEEGMGKKADKNHKHSDYVTNVDVNNFATKSEVSSMVSGLASKSDVDNLKHSWVEINKNMVSGLNSNGVTATTNDSAKVNSLKVKNMKLGSSMDTKKHRTFVSSETYSYVDRIARLRKMPFIPVPKDAKDVDIESVANQIAKGRTYAMPLIQPNFTIKGNLLELRMRVKDWKAGQNTNTFTEDIIGTMLDLRIETGDSVEKYSFYVEDVEDAQEFMFVDSETTKTKRTMRYYSVRKSGYLDIILEFDSRNFTEKEWIAIKQKGNMAECSGYGTLYPRGGSRELDMIFRGEYGEILDKAVIPVQRGDSVYSITKRYLAEKGIPHEIKEDGYLSMMFNLKEIIEVAGTGWMVKINNSFRDVGMIGSGNFDHTKLNKVDGGDFIEWVYTKDFGVSEGNHWWSK